MNVKELFRNLVWNNHIPGYEHFNTMLSFETVFYKTSYSYYCCRCPFTHEYLEYILEDGGIDEELYRKVEENITTGRCPHVDGCIKEYTCETSVFAAHIAAARDTLHIQISDVKGYPQYGTHMYFLMRTCLFRLRSFVTAVMKGSEGSSAMFAEYISRHTFHYCNKILDEFILIPRKLDDYPYLVQLHSCTILELCIERENVVLLKGILRSDVYHYNIQRVFETAFRLQPTEIQHALLLYDRDSTQGCRHPLYTGYRNSSFCPEAAIVCDRPDILRRYIQFMSRKKDHSIGRLLYETSIVLKRERCKGVLATYGMVDLTIIKPLSHLTQVRYLLSLLQLYKHVEHEIIVLLKTIPGVQELINTPYSYTDVKQFRYACENMTPLASYIVTAQYTENRVVTAMIQLGADIDCHDPDGQTPLLCLLKRRQITGMNRREILELLLYENVSLDERAVTYALHLDSEYGIQRQENLSGIYNTGTCEHSLFGFNSPENYAFNFAVPVLLESGSPCPEDILKDATKLTLHPSVNSYIRIYVNTPRSLQICCRNTLRKRFRGHQIYTYLEIVPCPATIKEFIALKQILE